jgi:transcriptional regulator with XRE-family HTH domain
MKTLGERIRELRATRDLSLRDLAAKLGGLSAAFLSDIELGKRFPSEKILDQMAVVLGTTSEDLRSHDTRAPIEGLRRKANADPAYGIALRQVLDKRVSAEELLKLAQKQTAPKKRS